MLRGFGFRQFSCGGGDVAGNPALCDRVIVGQFEYRTHLGFDFAPDWVIVLLFTGNDFRDTWLGTDRMRVENASVVLREDVLSSVFRWPVAVTPWRDGSPQLVPLRPGEEPAE